MIKGKSLPCLGSTSEHVHCSGLSGSSGSPFVAAAGVVIRILLHRTSSARSCS